MAEQTMAGPPALGVALGVAVPLWIAELQTLPASTRDSVRMQWARDAVEPITSRGDALQFGSKKRGEAADVFNHLARGLAAAAFQPGGITFAGMHFEAEPVVCTELTARWCPIHGTCCCKPEAMNDPHCTLHSPNSSHPDGQTTSRAARGDTRPVIDIIGSL